MKINVPLMIWVLSVFVLIGVLFFLPSGPGAAEGTDGVPEPQAYVPAAEEEGKGKYKMSVSTDNYTYYSRDDVQIEITIEAPEDMNDTRIHLFGIKNKYGAYKVERFFEMALTEGKNVIETKTNVPSCYGCSGIEPGVFQFHATLYRNESQILNASTDIEILD